MKSREDIWMRCEQIHGYPSKVNKTAFASNMFRVFLFISHKIINWLLLLKIICLNYIFTFVRRTVQKLDFFAVHTFYHIFQYWHTYFIFIFYYSRDLPANYQNKALCVSQNVLTIMMACFHSKSYGWLILLIHNCSVNIIKLFSTLIQSRYDMLAGKKCLASFQQVVTWCIALDILVKWTNQLP